MATALGRRRIAHIASRELERRIEAELAEVVLDRVALPSSWRAPFRSAYRTASLALVGYAPAMPAAVLVQRWSKVPWFGVLDADALRWLRAEPRGLAARALFQAAAVLVDEAVEEEARSLFAGPRVIRFGERERLARIAFDRALAPDARRGAGGLAAVLADGWTFLNDRATRLAIRAMPLTGKASQPIHPHHVVGGPWHLWYLKHLTRHDRVLDVGCANGAHTFQVAAIVDSVVGIDIDAAELRRAWNRADAEGVENVEFRLVDLSEPEALDELGRGAFDVALVIDVLEHLADRVGLLSRLRRVLQPGGRLIVSVPNGDTPYRRLLRRLGAFVFSDPDHKVEYSDESLSAELREAGFEITIGERGGYDSPFTGFSTLVGAVSLRAYRRLSERRARLSRRFPERAMALRVVAVPTIQRRDDRRSPSTSHVGDRRDLL